MLAPGIIVPSLVTQTRPCDYPDPAPLCPSCISKQPSKGRRHLRNNNLLLLIPLGDAVLLAS